MITKVGFIGVGQMGGALIQGFASSKNLKLLGFDLDQSKLKVLEKDYNLQHAFLHPLCPPEPCRHPLQRDGR